MFEKEFKPRMSNTDGKVEKSFVGSVIYHNGKPYFSGNKKNESFEDIFAEFTDEYDPTQDRIVFPNVKITIENI